MARRFRVEWSPVAIADLDDILEFIAHRETPERAGQVYLAISKRVETLVAYPMRGRIVPELRRIGVTTYREVIVGPYRVFSRIDGELVGIVGVLDGRRDIEEVLTLRGLKVR